MHTGCCWRKCSEAPGGRVGLSYPGLLLVFCYLKTGSHIVQVVLKPLLLSPGAGIQLGTTTSGFKSTLM